MAHARAVVPVPRQAPAQDRAEVLVLGVYHMANPGRDIFNSKVDDVLAPKRQAELAELVEVLKRFRPTKVAIESDVYGKRVTQDYSDYLAGKHELTRNEIEQVGFRLAKEMGHQTVYPVDVDGDFPWRFESARSVLPEDALFGSMMFPGKMLMEVDEAGGILSMRYCRGFVMTACLDAMDFYTPIFTHEVVVIKAAINHVGSSSLEIGVKVLAEKPWTGEVRHACTAYLAYVHLGPDATTRPCPPKRLVPPITAAAIAFRSSCPPPVPGSTERSREARMIPPTPAMKPEIMNTWIRIRSMLMPARRAASGFPPTA